MNWLCGFRKEFIEDRMVCSIVFLFFFVFFMFLFLTFFILFFLIDFKKIIKIILFFLLENTNKKKRSLYRYGK